MEPLYVSKFNDEWETNMKILQSIMPSDGLVTTKIYNSLNRNQLDAIEYYSSYVFPNINLEFVKGNILETASNFRHYNLIIAPGDTPSLYVGIIQCIQLANDTQIITFPISGLGKKNRDPIIQKSIDDYLKYIFHKVYFLKELPKTIGYFDYQSSGKTFEIISESIKRLFGDIDIEMIDYSIYPGDISFMATASEHYGLRVMKKYKLGDLYPVYPMWYMHPWELYKSNILILLMCSYIDNLIMSIPYKKMRMCPNLEDGFYEIEWLDPEKGKIRVDIGKVENGEFNDELLDKMILVRLCDYLLSVVQRIYPLRMEEIIKYENFPVHVIMANYEDFDGVVKYYEGKYWIFNLNKLKVYSEPDNEAFEIAEGTYVKQYKLQPRKTIYDAEYIMEIEHIG